MSTPSTLVTFTQLGISSRDGRCRSFGEQADGVGLSEGCGVVVLKRASDVSRDGDPVLALVTGTAVNHSGPSSGLTAPKGPSQQRLIRAALARAGLEPRDIDYVEAHGTGTPMGDLVEVGALAAVFGPDRAPGAPLPIGSIKSNLGHPQAAAGMASLAKVVLSLAHGRIPKSLHAESPLPQIDWPGSRLVVATEPLAWSRTDRPRRAGVSSFGISGTNAHVVVQEAPPVPPASPREELPPHLLLLSARSARSLAGLAEVWAAFLERTCEALPEVCATAATGRSHHAERLAIVAADRTEAVHRLRRFLAGEDVPGVWHGRAFGARATVAMPSLPWPEGRAEALARVAEGYVGGGDVDWRSLDAEPRRRVTLPTYVFDRVRYWREAPSADQDAALRWATGAVNGTWETRIGSEPSGGGSAPLGNSDRKR